MLRLRIGAWAGSACALTSSRVRPGTGAWDSMCECRDGSIGVAICSRIGAGLTAAVPVMCGGSGVAHASDGRRPRYANQRWKESTVT